MRVRFRDISKNGKTKTSMLINKKSCEDIEEIHFNYVIGLFSSKHKKDEINVFHSNGESSIFYKFYLYMDIEESYSFYCVFRAALRYYIELFDSCNQYENIIDFYKYENDKLQKIINKVESSFLSFYKEENI